MINYFKKVWTSFTVMWFLLISGDYKMIRFKNLKLGLAGQLPLKRFLYNFFITGNAWGMFSAFSHYRRIDDKFTKSLGKQQYNTKPSAEKAAVSMQKKTGNHFSVYKCIFCDGYHIGKNQDNK